MIETYRLLKAKRIGWKTAGAILVAASAIAGVHLTRPSGPDCYDSMGNPRQAGETPDPSRFMMTEHYGGGRKHPYNFTCVYTGENGDVLRLSFIDDNENGVVEKGEMIGTLNQVWLTDLDKNLPAASSSQ